MSAQGKAINALNEGLALVVNAGGSLDKADRLVHAEAVIRGVLRMLEAMPETEGPPLYTGEDFTVYERFCSADGSSAIITADLEYAKTGEHDFVSRPAGGFQLGTLVDVLRADLARTVGPAESRAVADDEIDEDPPQVVVTPAPFSDDTRELVSMAIKSLILGDSDKSTAEMLAEHFGILG